MYVFNLPNSYMLLSKAQTSGMFIFCIDLIWLYLVCNLLSMKKALRIYKKYRAHRIKKLINSSFKDELLVKIHEIVDRKKHIKTNKN